MHKNFAISKRKPPVLESFLTNFINKRDSNTGLCLWILRNFYEHLFLKNICERGFWNENSFIKDENNEHAGTIEKGIDQYVAHASVLLTKNIKVTTPFSFGEASLKDVEKEMLHLSSKKTRYVSKYTTKIF